MSENTAAQQNKVSPPGTRLVRAEAIPFTPASHELPSDPGCLKRVLVRKADLLAGQVQMINWSVIPPGKAFREHYHEDMQEIFVIVSGEAKAEAGDASLLLQAGDTWIVEPGTRHRMRALSANGVTYLVVGISSGKGGKTIVTS